jgi:hypothetical protein
MRCDLANRRNASRRRSWLLPGCAVDGLRVGGFPGKLPCAIGLWQESLPLIWADLRREGPISAYVAMTDCRLDPPKLLWSIFADRIRNTAGEKTG